MSQVTSDQLFISTNAKISLSLAGDAEGVRFGGRGHMAK
jgi:hypothetical protein